MYECMMNNELKNRIDINKNINRGYRELIVWQEAINLFSFVKHQLQTLSNVSYKVKAQVEDSILSVSSNIAEGYCRRSVKEDIQFISIALASLGENYSQITALTNSDDINIKWFDEYDKKHYSLENKLIKLNKNYIQKLKQNDDWKNDYILREKIENYKLE
jgi:four helix bundle protein